MYLEFSNKQHVLWFSQGTPPVNQHSHIAMEHHHRKYHPNRWAMFRSKLLDDQQIPLWMWVKMEDL